ncbi:MAG: mechanosensitive ion channel family protein [Spirochaetaceae bacterium]
MAQAVRGLFAGASANGFSMELLEALLVTLLGAVLIRLLAGVISRTLLRGLRDQSRVSIRKTITYVGIALLLVIALDQAGVELTALLGAAGVIGIAVGIASQASLSNIISGLFLVSEKAFEVGDVIRVGDRTGVVHSIDPLSIKLLTFDNLMIRIPNQQLIETELVNVTKFPVRRLDIDLTVPMSVPAQQLIDLLRSCATSVEFVLDEPEPLTLLQEIREGNLVIRFGVWFEKQNYLKARNAIFVEVQRRFREEGIRFGEPIIRIAETGSPEAASASRVVRTDG